jgi:hypothetical protein
MAIIKKKVDVNYTMKATPILTYRHNLLNFDQGLPVNVYKEKLTLRKGRANFDTRAII